ncbi:VOC family protein [Reichenbachiella versicolor]|uniref:VOC family protein n=1 Tax=Reichenbachiella versicolor TaxID=1821036 RepID=UPI0013A562A7|nr:VOC family protein [Reichenbachiella versicolor]
MKKGILLLLTTLFACLDASAQNDPNKLAMTSVTVVCSDIKTSATWYRRYMKFKMMEYRPEKYAKMIKGGFRLNLMQGQNTIVLNQINFSKGKKYVNGIDKIGFTVNQFDSLKLYLERYEETFVQKDTMDVNIGYRTMTVLDPDGNKIQFLEAASSSKNYIVLPKLFAISSSDYIMSLKWYKAKMGFKELKLNDEKNIHFQNYLRKDDILLELIHLPYESLETTEFMPVERDLASFDALSFKIGLAKTNAFKLDNNGNKIVLKH